MTLHGLIRAVRRIGERFLRPRVHGAYPLETVRVDGESGTLIVLLSGRGVLEHSRLRVRFDSGADAGARVAVPLRVTTGAVVTVRIRGLFGRTTYRFMTVANAPALPSRNGGRVRESLVCPPLALAKALPPLAVPPCPFQATNLSGDAIRPPLVPTVVRSLALRVIRERISVQ